MIVYTDGLQKHTHYYFQRVGSAAVGFIGNQETFIAQLGLEGKVKVYNVELTEILIGLYCAQSEAEKHPLINHIIIYSDNTSALTTICNPQPRKGQILAYDFYRNAIRWLEQSDTHQLTLAWCPGHLNIHGNERADELAKSATDLPGEIDTTTSHMLRRAREYISETWTKTWKNHPQHGLYAQANRFPPSLQPTPHFEDLRDKRELFGRLLQCRTGHGYAGDFYAKLKPGTDPSCPCGEPSQTRTHILRECHLYKDHRYILRKISPSIYPPDILGTRKGVEALAEFLSKSNAYTRSGTGPPTRQKPSINDRLPENHPDEGPDDEVQLTPPTRV